MIPFSVSQEEAIAAYQSAVRSDRKILGGYTSKSILDSITPAYVPCFFFNYHIYARAILSVVPYVKNVRDNTIGSRIFNALVMEEINFNLERSSSVAQPYAKNIGGEMAWKDIPISASTAISRERFFQISPFSSKKVGETMTASEKQLSEQAVVCALERSPEEIAKTLQTLIRDFVKECLITNNLEHFKITSFVDQTDYPLSVGQLVYVPVWCLKIRKKNQYFSWYMNGASAQSSQASIEETDETLSSQSAFEEMSKKRIKKYTEADFQKSNRPFNYRTYMVDELASAISADMQLNESAADKSLVHLERTTLRNLKEITVPIVEKGYQAEVEEEVRKSKLTPLPSQAVELPSTHSYLFRMKEESMKQSLGRGQRLPSKPMDRKVGNEAEFENLDNSHEYVAKEIGLADIPEYDPNGPNPFKR